MPQLARLQPRIIGRWDNTIPVLLLVPRVYSMTYCGQRRPRIPPQIPQSNDSHLTLRFQLGLRLDTSQAFVLCLIPTPCVTQRTPGVTIHLHTLFKGSPLELFRGGGRTPFPFSAQGVRDNAGISRMPRCRSFHLIFRFPLRSAPGIRLSLAYLYFFPCIRGVPARPLLFRL